jgi:hypothetical protein
MSDSNLKQRLEQVLNQSPVLGTLQFDTHVISPFIAEELAANLCGRPPLAVAGASIEDIGESVVIKGYSDILGLDRAAVEIRVTPTEKSPHTSVKAQFRNGTSCSLPGFEWITWESLELDLDIDGEKETRSGSINGITSNLADHRLSGRLEIDTGEDGAILNRRWVLEGTLFGESQLNLIAPPQDKSAAFDLIRQEIPAFLNQGIKSIFVNMCPGWPEEWPNSLALTTDFSWEMFPGVTIRTLNVSLYTTIFTNVSAFG